METAVQSTRQESRPELVLPLGQYRPDGAAHFEEYYQTAADKAYWILREKIISLTLAPGAMIRDVDLTVKLGIGRTPIREALKRLEMEMLVISHHRKGTYVNEITLADTRRQYQVHRQLISLAVALASQAGETLLLKLARKSTYLAEKSTFNGFEKTVQTIEELELEIAKAGGNPFLCHTLQQYCGYTRRICHLLKSQLTISDLQLEDFPKIMDCLIKNDQERASQLMALHVDQVHLNTVDRFLEKFI